MHDIKAFGMRRDADPIILPSALDEVDGKASDPGSFIRGERVLCAHSMRA
jgi:hypothetical protein